MSSEPPHGADFATRLEANVVSNELDVKAVATKVAAGAVLRGRGFLAPQASAEPVAPAPVR